MIREIHSRAKTICITPPSVFTRHFPKGQFRLLSLEISQTQAYQPHFFTKSTRSSLTNRSRSITLRKSHACKRCNSQPQILTCKINYLIFYETNGKSKKVILFCVLNMFHFVIKCGFALKMAEFFNKTTICHQIGLLAKQFAEPEDQLLLFNKINLKKQ